MAEYIYYFHKKNDGAYVGNINITAQSESEARKKIFDKFMPKAMSQDFTELVLVNRVRK